MCLHNRLLWRRGEPCVEICYVDQRHRIRRPDNVACGLRVELVFA